MLKRVNLIISRITFCVIRIIWKKNWSGIRSFINSGKVKADYIPSILESGKPVDNPCAIANIFNNLFVNVGKNTDKDIPCGNCCPTSFLKDNFPDSMFLSPFTSVEVGSYISQMDNNKSINPYSIPFPLLKILRLIYPHLHVFHPSLMSLFSVVYSPVNLNWQKLPQFLRKALGKTKITIGQYKFYPFLVKCLKRLYNK